MSTPASESPRENELLSLANLACEQQLDDAGRQQLESLLRSDVRLRALYVELIQLHAQLAWDAAITPGSAMTDREPTRVTVGRDSADQKSARARRSFRLRTVAVASGLAVCLFVAAGRRHLR